MSEKPNNSIPRSPIVAIMGHIDHGKSTLLDYIRKTNVVAREAGGITQHISAYEVMHQSAGKESKITFIDTPGHEAFSSMRDRCGKIADIAILIVSAEDGVKPQTIESWKTIKNCKIPVIVAINKIDKPGSNIDKTKLSLAEHEILVEGFGGDVPFVPISATTGKGIDELLSMISLVSEIENFTGSIDEKAEGYVLEANMDKNRGIEATLVIKNGVLKQGQYVVVGKSISLVKIMEDFLGKPITEAKFSSPIKLVGFDTPPTVGEIFTVFNTKDEAIEFASKNTLPRKNEQEILSNTEVEEGTKFIPLVLKADTYGSIEAIIKEVKKIRAKNAAYVLVNRGVGNITDSDITGTGDSKESVIIGFNIKIEASAKNLAERTGVKINTFNIIYKLTEFLAEELERKRPRIEEAVSVGKAKVLKTFNKTKDKQVIGGKVIEGYLNSNAKVKILRRDTEIGQGKIIELQTNKEKTGEVSEGKEFGAMIEAKIEIASGDVIEVFVVKAM